MSEFLICNTLIYEDQYLFFILQAPFLNYKFQVFQHQLYSYRSISESTLLLFEAFQHFQGGKATCGQVEFDSLPRTFYSSEAGRKQRPRRKPSDCLLDDPNMTIFPPSGDMPHLFMPKSQGGSINLKNIIGFFQHNTLETMIVHCQNFLASLIGFTKADAEMRYLGVSEIFLYEAQKIGGHFHIMRS